MQRAAAVLLSLCLLGSPACKTTVKQIAATAVLLRVHASDEVRSAAAQLRVTLSVQQTENGGWSARTPLTLAVPEDDSKRADFWPVDIPITPRAAAQPPHAFEVVAEALNGDGSVLVQQRAITGFVKEMQRMLELSLARCGSQALGTLCEQRSDCHGSDCQHCDNDRCTATAITDSDSLPAIGDTDSDGSGGSEASAGAGGRVAAGGGGRSGEGGGGTGKPAAGSGGRGGQGGGGGGAGKPAAGSGGAGGSSAAGESWSTPDALETGAIDVSAVGASRNAAGDMVVVWRQDVGNGPYWARRYVNGSWDEFAFNFQSASLDAGRFDISVGIDHAGGAQFFYSDGAPVTRWLKWKGEQTLPAAPSPLGTGQSYGYPAILEVTESGSAVALWGGAPDGTTQAQPLYVNRLDPTSGWGSPMQIGNTGAQLRGFGAGTNSAGDYVCLFRSGDSSGTTPGPNLVKSFVGKGGSVTTPTAFDVSEALASSAFLIGVDDGGNALTLFISGPDVSHLHFNWSSYVSGAASWSDALSLTPQGTVNGAATIANAEVVLASLESATAGEAPLHLVLYRFKQSSGWSAGERISDDFTSEAQDVLITANASGSLIVAWSENTTLSGGASGTALAYKRYSPQTGWGSKNTITMFAGSGSLAALTLTSDGHAVIAWLQDQSSGTASDLKWSRSQ